MTTLLKDRLIATGYVPREVAFRRAVALFINNGGTYERAFALLRESAKNAGERWDITPSAPHRNGGEDGHQNCAGKAISRIPESPPPDRSEEQQSSSKEDNSSLSLPAINRTGAGQSQLASKAINAVPRPGSPSSKYLSAAHSASREVARTVLDSFIIRDGRAIGDVTFGELEKLRRLDLMHANLFSQIRNHVANATPHMRVRDLIKPDVLERMLQKAAEASDAS